MPFRIRPSAVSLCNALVMYNAGPFRGQGTAWNLSCTSWRLSGDLPMRPGNPSRSGRLRHYVKRLV